MRKAELEEGRTYAVKLKTSRYAVPVIVAATITHFYPGSSVGVKIEEHSIGHLRKSKQPTVRGEHVLSVVNFIEPWPMYEAAVKAADEARGKSEKAAEETAVERAERLERVEKLVVVLQGIDYGDAELPKHIEHVWGGQKLGIPGPLTLDFLESVAQRINNLQFALVGHQGGWVESNKTEVAKLNDELSRQQEEAARLSLRLKRDGYTFKDINEIAKGTSEEFSV